MREKNKVCPASHTTTTIRTQGAFLKEKDEGTTKRERDEQKEYIYIICLYHVRKGV